MSKIIEVPIRLLKYIGEDDWLLNYKKEKGNSILVHPLYLAVRGDKVPLEKWCAFRQDIWMMERLSLIFDVYKSLIRYGQLEPILINIDMELISGHKRAICLLLMGYTMIKASYK